MTPSPEEPSIRPLSAEDIATVVEIDARLGGRRRPGFFEKRLAAALAEPKHFIYIGCERSGRLQGFLMARLLEGEYGTTKPIAVLDIVGVDRASQGQGIGRAMFAAMNKLLAGKGIHETQSQADWRNRSILRFFAAAGFQLASRHVLEREVDYLQVASEEDAPEPAQREIDFSQQSSDDPATPARHKVICRSLQQDDLPALVRIDRKLMGGERVAYYQRKVKEALEETGIRVSQVAELDGMVVGFVMARVDYGEFDRTEPTAVIDNIGVDPDFAQHRVGSALLGQLLGNLATLRLDRVRTEVGADHFDVLAFLMKNGFYQSQNLAFSRVLR